ncbi:hypothetical protein GCM10010315_34260 [Streptomyces luteosporeus]|uniref:RmlD-like substrate binding domain-containing protein n=1 Tax=Streptomyces luteosporeus TaxID=173856 RepID=A0ABN3TTM3_9ACTN
MTTLVIGGSGFLGTELVQQATGAGYMTVATYATKPGKNSQAMWHTLDLRDPGQIDAVMAEVRPHLVINASSGGADWAVTAEGPIRLAMTVAKYGTPLIHVSTDAVFSGARSHYDESCRPDPLTRTGRPKRRRRPVSSPCIRRPQSPVPH